MKLVFTVILFAFCCLPSFAQDDAVEIDFEKNKLKYRLEKFSEGEDASSGYDYFVYTDKAQIVKVREIWSSLSYSTYRAEDYYYKDGKLIALVKYTFDKKYYKTAEKGRNIPLKQVERLLFTDSKLTGWTENGKAIPTTDKRWPEREKEGLEAGKSQLENYSWLKKNE
jgi:hypothetical protein